MGNQRQPARPSDLADQAQERTTAPAAREVENEHDNGHEHALEWTAELTFILNSARLLPSRARIAEGAGSTVSGDSSTMPMGAER